MQRKDGPRRPFDSSPARFHRFSHPAGVTPDSESGPSEGVGGDLTEWTSNWETAWIDLGGEG